MHARHTSMQEPKILKHPSHLGYSSGALYLLRFVTPATWMSPTFDIALSTLSAKGPLSPKQLVGLTSFRSLPRQADTCKSEGLSASASSAPMARAHNRGSSWPPPAVRRVRTYLRCLVRLEPNVLHTSAIVSWSLSAPIEPSSSAAAAVGPCALAAVVPVLRL